MSSSSNTPPDGYFKGLSHPIADASNKRRRNSNEEETTAPNGDIAGDSSVPKVKRIACVICRKRKLKCDGAKPSCSTCTRLGHSCAYDEVRRKSGPKRGYVKALEERLKQVETLLKTQDPVEKVPEATRSAYGLNGSNTNPLLPPNGDFTVTNPSIQIDNTRDQERWHFPGDSPQPPMDDMTFNNSLSMGMGIDETNFTWEMIGLGLDEPLPPQETIDDLHRIYFEKIHPSMPMIHKYRYLAAMNLAPNQRPPVCLRYAMWTLACSVTEKYMDLKDHFYQRARKYVEQDYLKGHGEHMISVSHCQTHILLCTYEFKMMYFPRAWMSTGAGVRLAQMMGLHRQDGAGLDVKQCLPPPRDWTEREERRRTFWMAFCEDRYASIGTGWPMTIEEKDILSNLPASEEAFEKSKPEQTQTLAESFNPSGASNLSAFGGIVVMAALFGRNLVHLHRPDADDRDHDLNGEFWKRHRQMDSILLNTSLSLPSHLKLPQGIANANIVFTNMNIHTSTICLHQAAIFKADKNRLPANVSKESKLRCITAANEIANIMRMISHMDLSAMNPFISFCLYVAARVFVQYLKSRPDDTTSGDALRFLLAAMNAMKQKNPLTESFLVQLDVDLDSLGLRNPTYKAFMKPYDAAAKAGMFNCTVPDARVDQCHFLKIVDDSEQVNGEQNATSGPGANDFGISDSSGLSAGSDPNIDAFQPLDWIPTSGFSNRDNVLPIGMQGLILGQGTGSMFSHGSSFQSHMSGYGQSDNTSENGPSDRPTPTSTTPSDSRANLQPGHSQNGHSGRSSFETSPIASHQGIDSRAPINSFFSGVTDYTSIGPISTGLAPNNNYTLPETPGREFGVQGGWDIPMAPGMTPVGEGVFRELMNLGGSVDHMAWDGTS